MRSGTWRSARRSARPISPLRRPWLKRNDRPSAGVALRVKRSALWLLLALLLTGCSRVAASTASPKATPSATAIATWSSAGSIPAAGEGQGLTVLNDGRVLVSGGFSEVGGRPEQTASRYDPISKSWSAAASMTTARANFTSTSLQDGKVLVAGGLGPDARRTATAELYDRASNRWSPPGPT